MSTEVSPSLLFSLQTWLQLLGRWMCKWTFEKPWANWIISEILQKIKLASLMLEMFKQSLSTTCYHLSDPQEGKKTYLFFSPVSLSSIESKIFIKAFVHQLEYIRLSCPIQQLTDSALGLLLMLNQCCLQSLNNSKPSPSKMEYKKSQVPIWSSGTSWNKPKRMAIPWRGGGVHEPQWVLGGRCESQWFPHECLEPAPQQSYAT